MSSFHVLKSSVSGSVHIPPSKSQTLRAILFAALAKGKSRVLSPLLSNDSKAMLKAVEIMGAQVKKGDEGLVIEGTGGKIGPFGDIVDVGNSGICLRFLSALFALSDFPAVITGDKSIRTQRPMGKLIRALRELGASVTCMKEEGFAPLLIQGPLRGAKATLSGEDSQPVSALLIASALKKTPTEIKVKHPGELPWIEVTLDWLHRLDVSYEREGYELYRLEGNKVFEPFDYTVPGDFSSAAFPLAAALITGSEITLENLDLSDPQGDKAILEVVQKMGAKLEIDEKNRQVKVLKGSRLKGLEIDVNAFIDAVPILAVLGCYAEGKTVLKNAKVAREKECDRLKASQTELKKMGANIRSTPDTLVIEKSELKGANVFSHHDHRMAMALAVAAMGAKGETTVESIDCVGKTYPSFKVDFIGMGAKIR
ncbi:MAG: 3-phosphoshikimate 1-carboxyvinyltransferase [Chlamydiia bacterium]|nr:3-phosphoshikimate 1-carboxyvinyltransferase [Chlamydiia bacterium]